MADIQWVIFMDDKPISKAIDSLARAKELAETSGLGVEKLRIEGFIVTAGKPDRTGVSHYDAADGRWVDTVND